MFCKTCGREILDNAVVCPYCGCSVEEKLNKKDKEISVLSLLGFIFSIVSLLISLFFIVNVAGLTLSIIGTIRSKAENQKLRGLGIAGIAISAAGIVLEIILLAVGVSFLI